MTADEQTRNQTNGQTQNRTQKIHYLTAPLSENDIIQVKAGDVVYVTGIIYTARDEAHLRMLEFDEKGEALPFDLEGAVIYHCGPVMEKIKKINETEETDFSEPKWKAVAAGPTTSDRMTKMTPDVLKNHNIRALIGKGGMENTAETLQKNGCIYLSYTGGCAALAVDMIKEVKTVYWEDLGMPEAVWELRVEKFGPLIAGIDTNGKDLFQDVKDRAKESFKKQFA
ncbi:FumA C-terminus/TtdB family hydratase beta subunit [Methanimicrococcus sp. OttesenSCG-928-J09]|nr:FumA C-terminus/TtdB family hydratase beta subunit [Methanimicrococcus sp. OttesenSCG-928-J09]